MAARISARGKCIEGQCLDFCAHAGRVTGKFLRPCRCEDVASSCLRCCRSPGEQCQPVNIDGSDSYLQDGRPCLYGYCAAGRCQKTSANMIQRLFDFIEHLDSSTFVAFMKSNIVGTVMVFSLVVWIPLSWTISCIDKRNEKKSREENQMTFVEDTVASQALKSQPLARHLTEYTVKISKYRRTTRPEFFHYENSEPALSAAHPETLEAEIALTLTRFPTGESYHGPGRPSHAETRV